MPFIIILILIIGITVAVITIIVMKSVIAPKKLATVANFQKQGKHTSAVRIAKQITTKEPRNTEAHYLLALSYIAQNKSEIALMELKSVNQIGNFGGYCKENEFRLIIGELFEQFNQVGVTVLIASHDMDMIKKMHKRIITLREGRIPTHFGNTTDMQKTS